MKKKRIKKISWGVFLIAAAVFLVLNQLHLIPLGLSTGTVFWTIVFIYILFSSLMGKSLFGSLFAIAFLLIVYAKPLRITGLVPWTILLAAFLIWLGISLLFSPFKFHVHVNNKKVDVDWTEFKKPFNYHADDMFTSNQKNENDENVVINQRFSEIARYVHSENLRQVDINSSFGKVNVYLDSSKSSGGQIVVNLNSSFDEIALYVPKIWVVDNQLEKGFGTYKVVGQSVDEQARLVLFGRSSFDKIIVYYV